MMDFEESSHFPGDSGLLGQHDCLFNADMDYYVLLVASANTSGIRNL
jgi:hypothetical protein